MEPLALFAAFLGWMIGLGLRPWLKKPLVSEDEEDVIPAIPEETPIAKTRWILAPLLALIWFFSVNELGVSFLALRVAIFGMLLLLASWMDAAYFTIPDQFTLPGFLWAFLATVIGFIAGSTSLFAAPYDAVVGACTGAGAMVIIDWLAEVVLRKRAMGFGDITLMAAVGAYLGPEKTLVAILLGSFIGAIVGSLILCAGRLILGRGKKSQLAALGFVPFGAYLSPAAAISLWWSDEIIAFLWQHLTLRSS